MLENPPDLIPVVDKFKDIPANRQKAQILNFLHRGPVTFSTLVYDTNVGDISPLFSYFPPALISVRELNIRFGVYPTNGEKHAPPKKKEDDSQVRPRILLYPENTLNQEESDRNSSGESGKSTPEPGRKRGMWLQVTPDSSMPPSGPYHREMLMPTMPARSIKYWTDNGKFILSFIFISVFVN